MRNRTWYRNRYTAWVVLAGGLMITAATILYLKAGLERSAERDFVSLSDELQRVISKRLDDHARILLSGAAFFRASNEVTREKWRIFTQHQQVDKQLPGIQGIGYAHLIPRSDLTQHIQQIRSEGFPEYTVRPEGEREVYSSIVYLEPFVGRNLRAFGYDMFSEPVRRVAMERARDTDSAALSDKVILVQETDEEIQAGTLMYVPVYRNGLRPDSVEQRRAAIRGWVYSPYRMNDLIRGILGDRNLDQEKQLHLTVFDGEHLLTSSLLYSCHPAANEESWSRSRKLVRFTRQIPVDFNGHLWTLRFTQTVDAFLTADDIRVWVATVGGLFISFLLFSLVRVEDSLRQVTDRLSLAVGAGGVGIWDYDVVNGRLVWDAQMWRLYGITQDQFSGAYDAWQARLHPEDRQRGNEEIQLALQGKKPFDIEFRVLWPDRSTRHIRAIASVKRDASGRPLRMIGTNWDVTAQKRAEEALTESEANFRTFFESMTDMILVGTPEGRILFTNSAVSRTLGYTSDKLKEMHMLDVHPPDKRQEAEAIFVAMCQGDRESCSVPMMRQDGVLVPVGTRAWLGKWNGEDCIFGICKNMSAEQEATLRFERLFRKNPCLIALSTLPDQRFTDVNDAFLNTLGYTWNDIIGKTVADLNLFVQSERHAAASDQLQADGHLVGLELQVRRKDGVLLDGLFFGEAISSQGQPFLLTVITDITERKRAEVELARLSVILRELMRLATHFVNVPLEQQDMAIDQSLATMGQLIEADRAYLFAYDFGAGVMSNTHEWCRAGTTSEIGKLQAVSTALFPDWVEPHRRGEWVHIPNLAALPADSNLRQILEPLGIRSLITLPLMQGDACLGFVGFDAVREQRIWGEEELSLLRLLAELYAHFESRRAAERETRELQKRLTQARDEAQAAALAKSMFLANMSHEIRTPLNAILGYAQIMERQCRSCATGQRLNEITRSGEHLLELLTDLLELVRSDAHQITLVPSDFDFYQALEDVRLMFVRHPAAQALTLEVSHTADVPQFLCADSGKVRQILVNLVGNAIKFTEKGGVRLSASVVTGSAQDGITIAVDVEDTGSGIGIADIDRIFDIFEQTDSSRKGGKGTGLGLPLSRRYARALGGDVAVLSSRLVEGSCFRFTFHAGLPSGGDAGQLRRGNVLRLASDQRALRLLVVDDDLLSRDMLAALLEPVGFTVEIADSAEQALQRLRQANPVDLVLMDKAMPGMNGYEAIGRIRELPAGRELPVLVVTASGFADEKKRALAVGADGLVAKPVRREQLLEAIGRVAGAKYDYEQAPTVEPAATVRVGLDPDALARLPEAQRRILDQALHRGDILALRKVVAAIAPDQPALAAGISVLIDAYDYDRLRRLLDSTKGKSL
ncbi:MAG: CHASE domain-containing protein [Myxococcales bacterium]